MTKIHHIKVEKIYQNEQKVIWKMKIKEIWQNLDKKETVMKIRRKIQWPEN